MIQTERQYEITKQWAQKFQTSLEALASSPDSEWKQIQQDAINGQLEDLRQEITEYEQRRHQ